MKNSSFRGTPVQSSGPNGSGYGGMTPGSYGHGTPVNSKRGNPDNAKRLVSRDKYGMVETPAAGVQAMNTSNGNGVLFDGVSEMNDYLPTPAASLDSPVPLGKQMPSTHSADSGRSGGKQIPDQILKLNGILSRGMLGTSTPGGPADEMIADG